MRSGFDLELYGETFKNSFIESSSYKKWKFTIKSLWFRCKCKSNITFCRHYFESKCC